MQRFTLLVICAVVLSWTGTAYADPTGEKLLGRAEAVARNARTLQATLLRTDQPEGTVNGALRLMKPGSLYFESNGKAGKAVLVTQGDHLLSVDETGKSGSIVDVDQFYDFANIEPTSLFVSCYFEPLLYRSFLHPTFAGTQTRQGVTYQVVKCPTSYGRGAITFYIGSSGLPEGIEIAAVKTAETNVPRQQIWLLHLRLDAPLTAAQFAYTPPKTVKVIGQDNPLVRFLPINSIAPQFDLLTPTGEPLSLAKLLKGKKAVLLTFTFEHCGACVGEIPTLKRLYVEFKAMGLEIAAINISDDKEQAKHFIRQYQLPYPMGLDSKSGGGKEEAMNGYHADMGGDNYLISGEGKILWRDVGINETRIRCLLEGLHIKAFAL
jgi:peroxiredoxin